MSQDKHRKSHEQSNKRRRTQKSSSALPANYQAVNPRNVHLNLRTWSEFIQGFKDGQWTESAALCPFLSRKGDKAAVFEMISLCSLNKGLKPETENGKT